MDASLRFAQCLLCFGLVASTAYAGAGVNRCVSADGKVLLTDVDCPQGSQPDASDDGAVGIAINSGGAEAKFATRSDSGVERVTPGAPSALLPRSPWADLPRPLVRKNIGLDAGTLQAAYQTMQMQDEMRRQRHVAMLR